MHACAMDAFGVLLPVYVTAAELVVTSSIFSSIKMTNSTFFAIPLLAVGLICFSILKVALEFASKVTTNSRDFSRTPYPAGGRPIMLSQEEKVFLQSCKPLLLRVGDTFTITEETFPTISQDIIMTNVINLLVALQ